MKAKKRSCNSRESKWVESPGGYSLIRAQWGRAASQGMFFGIFCLKQGIKFIIFCLNQGIDLSIFVLNRINVLNRVSKMGILS